MDTSMRRILAACAIGAALLTQAIVPGSAAAPTYSLSQFSFEYMSTTAKSCTDYQMSFSAKLSGPRADDTLWTFAIAVRSGSQEFGTLVGTGTPYEKSVFIDVPCKDLRAIMRRGFGAKTANYEFALLGAVAKIDGEQVSTTSKATDNARVKQFQDFSGVRTVKQRGRHFTFRGQLLAWAPSGDSYAWTPRAGSIATFVKCRYPTVKTTAAGIFTVRQRVERDFSYLWIATTDATDQVLTAGIHYRVLPSGRLVATDGGPGCGGA